jgi:hypothetical protein
MARAATDPTRNRQEETDETDQGSRRAAEEAPPREVEAGAVGSQPAAVPVNAAGAVDENRPSDIAGQAETAEMSGPRFQPDVLDRPHVIAPQRHSDTPGQELSEAETER